MGRDEVDARSVVEGIPTAAEIAEASAELDNPSENQVLVEHNGDIVGYATIRWWQERDGTWLYLHRGYLLPDHRGAGIGSDMLSWAESRIRHLLQHHGTARTARCSARTRWPPKRIRRNCCSKPGTGVCFSLVELELADLPKPSRVRRPFAGWCHRGCR
ncbi:N-acetyltransferase domain-containing protein OS=Streptomyces microflavus OX=1919 GN=Smic_46610 PE=4 SV=1 [Streptomyces microflavus]